MEKKTYKAFGDTVYLLGKDADGTCYWLQKPTWDCEWYWGAGYVETYTQNERPDLSCDINSHQHFDSMFLSGPKDGYSMFRNFFSETVLDSKELWALMELMQSIYTLKKTAELMHRGGSHYTNNPCKDLLIDKEYEKKVNEVLLPALFEEVKNLLTK